MTIQLAWRMLHHQPDCTLVRWYRKRVEKANGAGKKTFIVALADKLLIALWRFMAEGGFPAGTVSGAPKVRAMQIDELEPERRGIYSGCIGYIATKGEVDTCTLCAPPSSRRYALRPGWRWYRPDSDPEAEYQETCNKALASLRAAGAGGRLHVPFRG